MEIMEIVGVLKFDWNEDKRLIHVFEDDTEFQIHGNCLYLLQKNPETQKYKVTKYELKKEWEQDSE